MNKKAKIISRDSQSSFYFDRNIDPIIEIQSGEEIIIETKDANAGFIRTEKDVYHDFSVLFDKAGGANPISGPIYIRDACVGDYLSVKILDIKCGGEIKQGYTALYAKGLGGLTSEYTIQGPIEARTKIYNLQDNTFEFQTGEKKIKISQDPFIGTIGVAPLYERSLSFYHGIDFCGNIDCRDIKKDKEVILPVNIDGALLSLGDIHAIQGDGEISGCALETEGNVRIKVEVIPKSDAKYGTLPQVNCKEWIGSIACPRGSNLSDTVRMAYLDLIYRMEFYYGFDKYDAYQLLSLVGEVSIGQVVEPVYSCVAKINREYLL